MTVLTLDLGTSATKAALWDGARLVAITRATLRTTHPLPGWAEQDPASWWGSVVDACRELQRDKPSAYAAIDAVGCSAARETFALFDADLQPVSAGILWSDRRADDEMGSLGDADAFRSRTGVIASAGCCAAKLAWVQRHEPDVYASTRWVLAPRDLVFACLTGEVATDETLASRTGWCDLDGSLVEGAPADRLPPVVESTQRFPTVASTRVAALGLRAEIPIVIGAGDRACEVLGVGASEHSPMVSWGTTANVSVPHPGPTEALPSVAQVSRGALGGFVVEAGLSAAGAAIGWLATLTGRSHDELLAAAADVEPGAAGVLAMPWLAGARAPWWQSDTHAAFVGLSEAHGPPELARAVLEGVAFDVTRCVELVAPEAQELSLAGGGAADAVWRQVLTGITGLPAVRRAIDDASSVGARLLVAAARAEALEVDDLNPSVGREEPEPALVEVYAELRGRADGVARAVLGVDG